jgi:NADH-quinone oxidoreductase subunit G
MNKSEKIQSNFSNEEILIDKLDYYYTNSISRASKTMSECRQINTKIPKTGTNN